MNMFKKNGGFTLVELIVVIAILAILAGVAVPAYNGYITKAQETADVTQLSAVKTACQAALATKGAVTEITVEDKTPDTIAVKVNGAEHTLTTDELKDICTYLGCGDAFAFSIKTGNKAVWDSSTAKWTISTITP